MERQFVRPRVQIAVSLVSLAACVLAVAFSAASFTDSEQNPQTVSAITDWTAPSAEASVIAQTTGGTPGYMKSKATYYVYANVVDSGSPASGVASVKANVSAITSGQTAVSLVAGSYTVGGVSYDYRSAQLTAGTLSAGSKSYSLALADKAGKSSSASFSVIVYAAFKGSEFETDNASGGTEGKPEKGDTVSFEFNNDPEASSIVSGWNGSGTQSVTVSIADSESNDTLSISGATLGSVALKGDFTDSTATFSGSTVSLSGSTATVVLGTASGSVKIDSDKSKAVWTPSASNLDLAGNACSTSNVTGGNKKQF
jgi:hypothetical protein